MEVKDMPKASRASQSQERAFELLRGGKVPGGAGQRLMADLKRNLSARLKKKSAIRRQAAEHLGRIERPIADNAKAARALSGLREITDRLAKQKLVMPRTAALAGGIIAGSYTLRFTPPYTALGESTEPGTVGVFYGNPTGSVSADPDLGQLNCSIATDFKSPSSGSAMGVMGVYFRPILGSATARVWFSSEIGLSWWVNSIGPEACAGWQGLIELYQYNGAFTSLTRGAFLGGAEDAVNALNFDFVSYPGPTWYLKAPVSSEHFYFVVISLSCSATGAGWPGSLAGAITSVIVPSITVEVTWTPVAVSI
jgi:hypothetical protein